MQASQRNVSGNSRNGGQNRADLEESVSPRENTRQSTLKNSMSIYGIYDPKTRQHIPYD